MLRVINLPCKTYLFSRFPIHFPNSPTHNGPNTSVNTETWYTAKGSSVHAILLKWYPNQLILGSPFNSSFDSIRLLGYNQTLEWSKTANQVVISTKLDKSWLPRLKWAWVFEFTNIKSNY